jgi:signal peptide peptidase SppA
MPSKASRQKHRRSYRAIVQAVHETPWAIREEKLQQIRQFLARRTSGDVLTADEVRAAMSGRGEPAAIAGKTSQPSAVALINVMGTIAQRLSLMDDISGGVSTEAVGKAIDAAVANGDVGTIVLNIDSPGGSVFGVAELADKIFQAKQTKRVIAVANSEAASAAYWLASQASELVVTPGGWVGSIGVLMIHYSTAGWEAKEGYETTITRTPAAKAEGAAGEVLSEEARAARQQLVDAIYGKFIDAVARGRGTTAANVKANFGGGRMLLASDALAAGMVNRIATLAEVLSGLGVSAAPSGAAAKASSTSGSSAITGAPAFSFEGNDMNKKIFGALVRIGMCPITATQAEATDALDRFFAAAGVDTPAKEEEQLAALEAHIKQSRIHAEKVADPRLATRARAVGMPAPAISDDRAEDITAAVRLSSLDADRKVELIGELIGAKDEKGAPITVAAAVRRLQKEQSEKSKAAIPRRHA